MVDSTNEHEHFFHIERSKYLKSPFLKGNGQLISISEMSVSDWPIFSV